MTKSNSIYGKGNCMGSAINEDRNGIDHVRQWIAQRKTSRKSRSKLRSTAVVCIVFFAVAILAMLGMWIISGK